MNIWLGKLNIDPSQGSLAQQHRQVRTVLSRPETALASQGKTISRVAREGAGWESEWVKGCTLLARLSALGVLTLALLASSLGLLASSLARPSVPRGLPNLLWMSLALGACTPQQPISHCAKAVTVLMLLCVS